MGHSGNYRRPLGNASARVCSTRCLDRKEQHIKPLPSYANRLFGLPKCLWLLDAMSMATCGRTGEIASGTIDYGLLWNVTAGEAFCSDYSQCLHQLLTATGPLDDEMLALSWIPRGVAGIKWFSWVNITRYRFRRVF